MLDIMSLLKTVDLDLIYVKGVAYINLDYLAIQLGVFEIKELLISNEISLYENNVAQGISLRDGFKLIILLSEHGIRTYELEIALIELFMKLPELRHQFPENWLFFP